MKFECKENKLVFETNLTLCITEEMEDKFK